MAWLCKANYEKYAKNFLYVVENYNEMSFDRAIFVNVHAKFIVDKIFLIF